MLLSRNSGGKDRSFKRIDKSFYGFIAQKKASRTGMPFI
jgi:hypothetical protein